MRNQILEQMKRYTEQHSTSAVIVEDRLEVEVVWINDIGEIGIDYEEARTWNELRDILGY